MKKTLISLMAVDSCAMGMTLENATFVTGGNTGYNTLDGAFSVAITFNVDSLRTYFEKGQPIDGWGTMIVEYDAAGTRTGICNNGGSNGGKINSSALYSVWGGTTNRGVMRKNGDTNVDLASVNWDNVASAGMVYTFDKYSGTSVALTLLGSEGDALVNTYAVDANLKTQNANASALTFNECVATTYFFDTTMNQTDSMAVAALAAVATPTDAPVIPEPTTATLSLLALAGLAARRRRR